MADDDKKRPRSRVKKVATGVVLVAIASCGFMGFLHTKWGKPLLMKAGGCPVATPEELDHAKIAIMAKDTATREPSTRFALGFDLDVTTIDDVHTWAKAHSIQCEDTRSDTVVTCSNVPVASLPSPDGAKSAIQQLTFGFWSDSGKLNNVSAWRRRLPSDIAAADIDGMAKSTENKLGPPTRANGQRTQAYFDQEGIPAAAVEYDLAGYKVALQATKMPDGVWVREVYVSSKVTRGT